MKFFIDDLPVGFPCKIFREQLNNPSWQIVFPYDRIYPGTSDVPIKMLVTFNLLQNNMRTCVI